MVFFSSRKWVKCCIYIYIWLLYIDTWCLWGSQVDRLTLLCLNQFIVFIPSLPPFSNPVLGWPSISTPKSLRRNTHTWLHVIRLDKGTVLAWTKAVFFFSSLSKYFYLIVKNIIILFYLLFSLVYYIIWLYDSVKKKKVLCII